MTADISPARRSDRREERWSDCWPDWSSGIEDAGDLDILARRNSPRIVFAEIGRVLAAILLAVVAVNVALRVFH